MDSSGCHLIKVLNYRALMVSILGIVSMVLGRYLIARYLDPSGSCYGLGAIPYWRVWGRPCQVYASAFPDCASGQVSASSCRILGQALLELGLP